LSFQSLSAFLRGIRVFLVNYLYICE